MDDINDILHKFDIDDIIKYYIIKLKNLNGFNLNINLIENTKLISYLDIISDYNKIILIYDIEFFNILYTDEYNNKYLHTKKLSLNDNEYYYNTIRELGGLVFIKSNNNLWYYIGDFLFTFDFPINKKYLCLISNEYSDVTDITRNNMINLENQILLYKKYNLEFFINNINHDNLNDIYKLVKSINNDKIYKNLTNNNIIFFDDKSNDIDKIKNNLKKLYRELVELKFHYYPELINDTAINKIIYDINNLYINDDNIQKRMIKYDDLDIFINIFNRSKKIGKELIDISAIINTSYLKNTYRPIIEKYFDIAFYNPFSRLLCNGAKLETTYNCVLNKLDSNIFLFNSSSKYNLSNIIDLSRAHNPTVDAYMTLIVCFYIIKKLNN